jgi:O-antigen ligase
MIMTERNPVGALMTVLRRCAYIHIPVSVLLIKYLPMYGRGYNQYSYEPYFSGVTIYKNALGILCVICALYFVWDLISIWSKEKKYSKKKLIITIDFVYLLMIFWLMSKADSSTSLGTLIIGFFILMGVSVFKKNIKYVNLVIFHVILIIFAFQVGVNIFNVFAIALEREMTLTGRTKIWTQVLEFSTNPLVGSGYQSFWLGKRMDHFWDLYSWKPNQAHNGYLEIYLNLGSIGIILLTGAIISTYIKCKNELLKNFEFGNFRMTLLFTILFYNITEALFLNLNLIWFVFLLISMEYKPDLQPFHDLNNRKL